MSDQLAEIESRWSVPPLADPTLVAVIAHQDIAWLAAEVKRFRKALEQIADDGVEGYESPQKRVALAALGQKGEAQ